MMGSLGSPNEFDLFQKRHFQKVEERQFKWLTQNLYIVEKEKQLLLEILKEKPKRILEVGCGEGANLVNLKKFGFKGEITGVDLSKAKISFAQKKISFAKLIEANAYSLPFESEQFDLVFCKNVLHHLANKEKAISEMARVCRVGGKVIIIEGNGRNILIILFGNLFPIEKNQLESTPENISSLIEGEKFLKIDKVFLAEPFNLFRALFHHRFGFPGLVRCGKTWLKIDKFFSRFIPQSQYGYIVIRAKRLSKPSKFESLRGEKEKPAEREE